MEKPMPRSLILLIAFRRLSFNRCVQAAGSSPAAKRRWLSAATLIIVTALRGVVVADDPEPSPGAQKIIERALEGFQKNYEVYAKASAKVIKDAERDLGREIERLTKAGDLEGALRVKALLGSLPQLQARAENGQRQEDSRNIFQPTMRAITWAELQTKPQVKPGKPTRAVSSSAFPGNWGTGNALDGNRDTEFAFLGPKGSVLFEFAPAVEYSAVVFESRRGPGDSVSRGAIQINGKYSFPIQNFGGGAIVAVMLGDEFPVQKIQLVSEDSPGNPGIAEVYFLQ